MRLYCIFDERGIYLRAIAASSLDEAWRKADSCGLSWRGPISIRLDPR